MKQQQRIEELDGLRGIAVILVLIWHYFTCQYVPSSDTSRLLNILYAPTAVFWSGVDLFFVLSGFLIGGIIVTNQTRANFLTVFWIRRICRIVPPFILLFISYIALKHSAIAGDLPWLFEREMPALSYATFTQNIFMGLEGTFGANYMGVTWSLAIEEQFYLFAPLLAMWMGRKYWTSVLVPLALTALILRLVFPGFHTYVNTVFRMDALLFGCFIAAMYHQPQVWEKLHAKRIGVLLCLGVVLGAIVVVARTQGMFHELKFFWFAVFYSTVLLFVLFYSGASIVGVLRTKALTFWGSIAYGLYLYHQAVSGLLHGIVRDGAAPSIETPSGLFLTFVALILSTALSVVSFRFFETYFINKGRSFRYR